MLDTDVLPATGREETGCLWTFAGAELDERQLKLKIKGEPVELDYKSIEVLLTLLRHAGEVVTKDELFATVWAGRVTVEGVLTNAISKLRKALGEEVIVTQHRIGYRFTAPVTRKALGETPSELQLNAGDPVPGREAWRLLRALGTGGEGEVWLAEQAKTREQRVFKFAIDAGRLSSLKREATLYRLLREVLGERKDFARVLEWNFEAPPFFLECEYGGLSLSDWAQQGEGLSAVAMEDRLRLMAEIAEAVAAAHSAGVLHKDLKPGNVLIWRDEAGVPHARLTDFGCSRLLAGGALDAAGITQLGFTLTQATNSTSGTPLYIAPELLAGQLPTVQSDLYSLGVMLYQLVVGDLKRPLSAGWEQDIADPLVRADIAAAAHGRPGERLAAVAELALRLRTLPARRTEAHSQSALAERAAEAEHQLQRERARKPFVLAAMAALLLGLAASLWFYWQADAARGAAERQARLAEAINLFLNRDLLAKANPVVGGRSNITVEEAAKSARSGISEQFAQEPLIAAMLHRTLGGVFSQLTQFTLALEEYRQANALLRKVEGVSANTTLLTCIDIVQIRARNSEIEAAGKDMLGCEADLKGQPKPSAEVLYRQAMAKAQMAQFAFDGTTAAGHYEKAIEYLPQLPERMQDEAFTVRQNLGSAYTMASRPADAEKVLLPLIKDLKKRYGSDNANTIDAESAYAQALFVQERFADVLPVYESLEEPLTRLFGENHQSTLQARGERGVTYAQLGRVPEAIALLKDVVQRLRTTMGPSHLLTLVNVNSLANVFYLSGDVKTALLLQSEVRQKSAKELGDAHPFVQAMRFNLVEMFMDGGDIPAARRELKGLTAEDLTSAIPAKDWPARLALAEAKATWLAGDRAAAKKPLEQALAALNPDSSDSRRMTAAVRKMMAAP